MEVLEPPPNRRSRGTSLINFKMELDHLLGSPGWDLEMGRDRCGIIREKKHYQELCH